MRPFFGPSIFEAFDVATPKSYHSIVFAENTRLRVWKLRKGSPNIEPPMSPGPRGHNVQVMQGR